MDRSQHRAPRRRLFRIFTRSALACAIGHGALGGVTFMAVVAVSSFAMAQTAAAQGTATQLRSYSIPAGTLEDALNRFGREAGILLSFTSETTVGLRSNGLQGSYSVQGGLDVLLAGSGLRAIQQANGSYLLVTVSGSSDAVSLLPTVMVQDTADSPGGLPPAYAGNQVARGGRLGILGNTDIMDAPFNITSYTAELIQNQQARTVNDVLANDPSVRSNLSAGSSYEGVFIRGFPAWNGNIAFNGLAGMAPRGRSSVEAIERVEVLKGPSAMLSGMIPDGSIGGAIMLVPKRADDNALTRLGVDYRSVEQFGAHLDIGRRFGANNAFGIRFNGVLRDGEGPIEGQGQKLGLAAIGLDYRGDRLRFALDAYHQRDRHDGGDYGIFFAGAPGRAPNSSKPISLGPVHINC